MINLAMLYTTQLVSVCVRKDLPIMHWLDCAVVVLLVNLLINSCSDVFVLVRLDSFVLNSRSNRLVNTGVVMARTTQEIGDSCLRFVHCVLLVKKYWLMRMENLF